jgi:hypothetical protein
MDRKRKIQVAFIKAELAFLDAIDRPYAERDYEVADKAIYKMRCARKLWRRLTGPEGNVLDRVLQPVGVVYERTLHAEIIKKLEDS